MRFTGEIFMKYIVRNILLLLLGSISHYAISLNEFHFSLEKDANKAFVSQDDFVTEDLVAYDMVCDRTIFEKPSFFKRMCIKLYTFWNSYSDQVKYFVVRNYTKLKKYTYAWYLYLYNYNNRIKK